MLQSQTCTQSQTVQVLWREVSSLLVETAQKLKGFISHGTWGEDPLGSSMDVLLNRDKTLAIEMLIASDFY